MYNTAGGGGYNIPFQSGHPGLGGPPLGHYGHGGPVLPDMGLGMGTKKPIGIFWDIENCGIPKGKSGSSIVSHIRNSFVLNRLNHREFEFLIACDVVNLNRDVQEDINRAGCVTIAHVSSSSKNAADEKLRECMKKFMDTHGHASPTLVLISGDIDFVHDLRAYQTRLGCYVILLYGPSCSPQFKQGWNESYDFRTFCSAVVNTDGLEKEVKQLSIDKKSEKKPQNPGQKGKPNQNVPGQSDGAQGKPGQKSKLGPSNRAQGSADIAQGKPGQKAKPGTNGQGPSNGTQAKPDQKGKPGPNDQGPFAGTQPKPGQKAAKAQQQNVQPPPPPKAQLQGNAQGSNKGPQKQKPAQASSAQQQGQIPVAPGPIGKGPNKTPAQPCPNKKEEIILMVAGLPGKLDFKILKVHLQEHAKEVNGYVKFVKNGQGFITFKRKEDADRAVELFNGREIFGKKLRITFASSIPFDTPREPKGAVSASAELATPSSSPVVEEEFVIVDGLRGASGKPRRRKRTQNSGGEEESREECVIF